MWHEKVIFILLIVALMAAPAFALTTTFSRSPLLGKGDGQSFSFQGDFGINPMTRAQTFSTQLLSLPGRAGLDISIGLSFQNNFWSTLDNTNFFSVGIPDYYAVGENTLDGFNVINDERNDVSVISQMEQINLVRPEFSSDIKGVRILPPNNLGGWSLLAPSQARLYLRGTAQTYVTQNAYGGSTQNTKCSITAFNYVSPDGSVARFVQNKKLDDFNCMWAFSKDYSKEIFAPYMNSLGNKAEFYSEENDGKKIVLTGETRTVKWAGGSVTGSVARAMDTNGYYVEFVLIGIGSNYGSESVLIAEGIPQKIGDKFGNYISITYDYAYGQGYGPSSAAITDTAGREVVINYDKNNGFPYEILAKKFHPNGDEMKITMDFQEIGFENQEMVDHFDAVQKTYNKPFVFTDEYLFQTIQRINLPNNLNWEFDYDRGWGKGSLSTGNINADGSITAITTPYNKKIRFLLDRYKAPDTTKDGYDYQDIYYFLDPYAYGSDPQWVRYGYVSSAETYKPNGELELKTTYRTEFDGENDPNNAKSIVTYYDNTGTALKREEIRFERDGDKFKDKEYALYDELNGGRLLQTVKKEFFCEDKHPNQGSTKNCMPKEIMTQQDDVTTKSTTTYDKITRDKYEYQSTVPNNFYRPTGSNLYDSTDLIKTDKVTYADDTKYLQANLIGLVKTQQTFDANNNLVAWSEIKYDTQAVVGVDRTKLINFNRASTPIGIPTEQIRYDPQGKLQPLTTKTIYNEAGQAVKTINPRGYATTTEYDPVMGCSGAYPTKVTNALGHTSSMSYDCNSGVITAITDANSLVTRAEYNDPLLRITKITNPDRTFSTTSYDDPANKMTGQYFSSTGRLKKESTTYYDGSGRAIKTEGTNPNGFGKEKVVSSIEYDALGRQHKTTNVYGFSALTEFDALDRPVTFTAPNGATSSASYNGRRTKGTDIYGREKETENDALGRLVKVRSEDGRLTKYEYDLLGNLLRVLHPSGQERSFTYDGFGRLLTTKIPEKAGVSSVEKYDEDGNPLTVRTASNYIIKTTYDTLDRPLTASYEGPVPTASVSYAYDTAYKGIGKPAKITEGSISRAFEYDSLGRIKSEKLRIGENSYFAAYNYNDIGSLESLTMPDGRILKYQYNDVGNLAEADMKGKGTTATAITVDSYARHGAAESQTYGNGIKETLSFDRKTLLPTSKKTGSIASYSYNYNTAPEKCDGTGFYNAAEGANIGTIDEQVLSSKRRLLYGYDCLDRLKEAVADSSGQQLATGSQQASGGKSWQLRYAFDENYNKISQSGVAAIEENVRFDANNHVNGFAYDDDGNVIDDGRNKYVYDGAGRLVSAKTSGTEMKYTYLGSQRIIANNGKNEIYYIRDSSGLLLSEYEKSDAKEEKEQLKFYHRDHLGSVRLITDEKGNVLSARSFYPYGEEETQSQDTTTKKFTGHERDKETGDDYMNARYYTSTSGVFLSVDSGKPDLANPQTWNRYAYANNNPVKYVDANGKVSLLVLLPAVIMWASAIAMDPSSQLDLIDLQNGMKDKNYLTTGFAAVGLVIPGRISGRGLKGGVEMGAEVSSSIIKAKPWRGVPGRLMPAGYATAVKIAEAGRRHQDAFRHIARELQQKALSSHYAVSAVLSERRPYLMTDAIESLLKLNELSLKTGVKVFVSADADRLVEQGMGRIKSNVYLHVTRQTDPGALLLEAGEKFKDALLAAGMRRQP